MDIIDKQERLERRRALVWEKSKICLDLVKEMVEAVGSASTMSMMSAVVGEIVERAEATGHEHPLLKGAHDEETETGPGLSAMVMEPGYEMLNKDTLPEVVVMLSEEEEDKKVVPV